METFSSMDQLRRRNVGGEVADRDPAANGVPPTPGGWASTQDEDEDETMEDEAVRDHLLGHTPTPTATAAPRSGPADPWAPTSTPPNPENIPLPSSRPNTPPPAASRPGSAASNEEPLCRICFDSTTNDPSLGRLIRPCLCRGTQAMVHVGCLQRWRRSAANRKSFWECDMCRFRYQLRRTKVAGLAQNRFALGCMTLGVFTALVTLSGYIAGYLVESAALRDATYPSAASDFDAFASATSSWSIGIGPFYYDSSGRLMGDALGEAVRVLNHRLNVDSLTERMNDRLEDDDDDSTSSLEPVPPPASPASDSDAETENDDDEFSRTYRYRRVTARQDLDRRRQQRHDEQRERERNERLTEKMGLGWLPPWATRTLRRIIEHQIMGLAFVGIISFFQLIISVTFFSPLNYTLRNTLFRVIRGNRRDGDGAGLGSAMILLIVLTGAAKALHATWKGVKSLSHYLLSKVEDHVLEVR